MNLARALPATLILAAALPAAAQSPLDGARAEARFQVRPSGAGPQRLDVSPELLSASAAGDLADLRLVDGAGREVPYLLVPPPAAEPARWTGVARIRAIPPTRTESGAEIDLGAVRTVAALEVELPGDGYLKKVRLEGSADGRRWAVLVPEAVLYQLPLDPGACGATACPGALVRRELPFDAAAVRFLRLVLDDRRGARLRPPVRARALLATEAAPAAGPAIPLAVTRREGEPGTSRFALRLPGPHLPVRAVALEVDAARLARRARVLEAHLSGGRLVPVELGSGLLLQLAREGAVASALRLPVRPPEELELELVVEDDDNPPLPLAAARAELAPLPWIFFESADGAPVEARLGDPARTAPRYDLEALRPQLGRLRPARATTAPLQAAAPSAPDATVPEAARAGAPIDRAAFRYARGLPAAAPGLSAVRLDADVLGRSPSLSDLRLAGPDGRQIPYLLEQRDEPQALPLAERTPPTGAELPRELAGAGRTVHALLAPAQPLPASQLVLETAARVFSRRVQVWVEPEGSGRTGALVAEATWAHADPERPAPPLALAVPRLRAARVLVVVGDGDNAPLRLSSARLLLSSYRLRFFHPGTPLTLLYGADLPAPEYDLALLGPRLRAAAAGEGALSPDPAAADAGRPDDARGPRSGAARIVFWVVLGLAVLGLLALVARLLARGENAPP